MPSKVDMDEEPPMTINPYEVLGVEEMATVDQIKSAYRKQALKHHPDKAPPASKETANAKFQEVAFAYAILSDERRRKRYDTTGNISESLDLDDDDFNWAEYFREHYATAISFEILEKTKREYQGSDEEKQHLFKAYNSCRGDMDKIFQEIMLSNPLNDEDRFCAIFDKAIKEGEINPLKKYTEEPEKKKERRLANARREAEEAEEAEEALRELQEKGRKKGTAGKSKKKGSDDGDLVALIQRRQKSRAADFFDGLEAKYGGSGKELRKRGSEPSEEAFAEVAARTSKKQKREGDEKPKKRAKPAKVA